MIFAMGSEKVICPIKGTDGIEENISTCKLYTCCGALESTNARGKCPLAVHLCKGFIFFMPPSVYLSVKWGIIWEEWGRLTL